ncbi:hypothetical protein DID77_00115 [Candidatus Marinamargulisbacteria bacterium SCGC AG-439-L15]|nr:hypothetical protein DID77_00115 [Candidatus Marinamargulisbacteria bacterium SCGC AG-439-L15]
MISILYLYILDPKKALRYYSKVSITHVSFVVLSLLAFMLVGGLMPGFLIRELFWIAFLGGLILVQSGLMDFTAQILGAVPQSYRLFQWFCLSLLPMTLFIPFNILEGQYRFFTELSLFFSLLILGYTGYLQYETVRFFYNRSPAISFLIFLLPVVITFSLFILGLLYLGVLIGGLG